MYFRSDLKVAITSNAQKIERTKRTSMQIKLFISASHIPSLRCDIVLCDRYVPSLLSRQPSFLGKKTRERQKISRSVGDLSTTAHGFAIQTRTVFGISTASTHVCLPNCRFPCSCAYSPA